MIQKPSSGKIKFIFKRIADLIQRLNPWYQLSLDDCIYSKLLGSQFRKSQGLITALDVNEIDDLHIPPIGFLTWFCTGDSISIHKSIEDKSLRKFAIRYFLKDLRAGTVWVHLQLDEEISLKIDPQMNIWFEKNEKNYLQSILIEVVANGCHDAFKKSVDYVLSLLSTLCFFYRRPLKLNQVIVYDSIYNFQLQTNTFCPKPAKLVNPPSSFKSGPIGSLISIYREGMNSVDLSYRYICFFKIYEAWQNHSNKFGFKNKRNHLTITKNLLGTAYRDQYHKSYLHKSFNKKCVYESLNKIRDYLVHPVIHKGIPPSFYHYDSIEHMETMEAYSNLIERIVTKILDVELTKMSEEDPEIKMLLNTFNLENDI